MGWVAFEAAAAVLVAAAAIGHGLAVIRARRRGPWPLHRTLFWYAGLACVGAALVGPIAAAAHASFTGHMVGHLLLGMIGPLLLVRAAPVTLALRALPTARARSLSALLRTPWVRFVTHPVVAAVLNAGGLWVLYATDLYHATHGSVWVHALVHAHVFLAGYVFTESIVGVDPNPRRASMRTRSVVLVAFIAAHSILSKWLYANPPVGVEVADARAGAQLMYYGGDAVDVLIIVLLFAGWYSATRPRATRTPELPVGAG